MEKFLDLKTYILTKYEYYADLGKMQHILPEREQLESDILFRAYSDVLEVVENIEQNSLHDELKIQRYKLVEKKKDKRE